MIATGATPRTLPGTPTSTACFVLRTLDDALTLLRDRSTAGPRVVVVGAGFIGSEVAATCRDSGLSSDGARGVARTAVRGLGPVLGMVCGELHRDHGVDLRLGVGVSARSRVRPGRARPSRRRRTVDADVVVVGVGVMPVTDWLEGPDSSSTTASCATRRCSRRRDVVARATSPAGRTRCSTAS